MAAVTIGKLHPVTVPGYEVNDRAQASEDIDVGELVVINTDTPGNGFEYVVELAPAGATADDIDGIALMTAKAGQICSVGVQGEMDGFAGMTRGARLWPSATVPGGLDTTLVAGAPATVKAVTATRIRYSFV